MKASILTLFYILLLCSLTHAQIKSELKATAFEKTKGKVLRIEKYIKNDVISEATFTIPRLTHDEQQFFGLSREHTSFEKNAFVELIGNFLVRNKNHFDFKTFQYIMVTYYFNKNTFQLEEIVYVTSTGAVRKNYSILRDLTDEIKKKGYLYIKPDFRARVNESRAAFNKFSPSYFSFSVALMGKYELKPYLSAAGITN